MTSLEMVNEVLTLFAVCVGLVQFNVIIHICMVSNYCLHMPLWLGFFNARSAFHHHVWSEVHVGRGRCAFLVERKWSQCHQNCPRVSSEVLCL